MPTALPPASTPIPYGRQHITPADVAAVTEALQADFLTQGPRVAAFETAFAAYVGAPYAVAVANGTAALHLCALALGVQPGQRVITTPITFSASANCVRYCGGEVWFADIDPATALLDLAQVRALLVSKPRGYFHGLIPVAFAGRPVELTAFRALADEFGLWLLEDACHAPGGSFTTPAGTTHRCGDGSLADLAIFSFHPVKHIATGEGGMITTARRDLYEALLELRTHGITRDPARLRHPDEGGWYHEMQHLGYNYRLPDLNCALGLSQLQRADDGLARRRALATRYHEAFADLRPAAAAGDPAAGAAAPDATAASAPGQAPWLVALPPHPGHAYHLYVVQVPDRRGLYDFLRTRNIFAQVHYIPVHRMPYYEDLGWRAGDFPHAEQYYAHCLSLPLYPTLTDPEQAYVIACVREFLGV